MQPFPDAELGKAIMALLNSIDENKDGYRRFIVHEVRDNADRVAMLMKNKYGEETNELRADRKEREKILAMTPEKREWYYLRKDIEDVVAVYGSPNVLDIEPSVIRLREYLKTHPE